MAKRKSYTDDYKAGIVLMLEAAGYPHTKGALQRVANKTGVPHPTISRWFRKVQAHPPDNLVQSKKGSLIERLDEIIDQMVDELPSAIPDAGLRELTTGIGTLIDKRRLLSGESTDNNAVKIQITYADN